MKKFIFLFAAMFAIAISANAQVSTMTGSADSVSGTGTKYLTVTVNGAKSVTSFQLICTKIRGTVSGTATLEASIDGTNYTTIDGKSAYTVTNTATQNTNWYLTPSAFQYYRIKIVGGGANQSFYVTGKVLTRN